MTQRLQNNITRATSFRDIFFRLLAREKVNVDTPAVSLLFEVIANTLLRGLPQRSQQYFDGAVGVVSTIKSTRQIEFQGDMWVGTERDQWTESFRVTVTDKRVTKQGIWLIMKMGSDRGEGELMDCFGCGGKQKHGGGNQIRQHT